MSREELLREIQRYHLATESAYGILRVEVLENPYDPRYSGDGIVARAFERTKAALAHVNTFDGESVYRKFFRYASCLLFPGTEEVWAICDQCETMSQRVGGTTIGTDCWDCHRKGITSVRRAITWDDLKPRTNDATTEG